VRRLLAALAVLSVCLVAVTACSSTPSTTISVSGSYGSKPKLTFPSGGPPKTLTQETLKTGTGPVVAKGDLLVADYLGQIWDGKVFDNSYDRGVPAGFPIGVGQVIPAWDKVLVGKTVGSRILMTVPPSDGYGSTGNSSAGIKGTDTLVFVVDIVATYPATAAGQTTATPQPQPADHPQVTGPLGKAPTVTVAAGTPKPTKAVTYIVAKGTGALAADGELIVQYTAVSWAGKTVQSSWTSGPATVAVGPDSGGSPFDTLVGVPIGSRVLTLVPESDGQGPYAVAVDIIAQALPAKDYTG
jgi:peptidylprolyl isomerase